MTERHLAWIAQIERCGGVGSLVWVGAGNGTDLPPLGALAARQIVLVEPDPLHSAALERIAAGDPRVNVLPCAIGTTNGHADLRRFNWLSLSSLSAPEGLHKLFPGLREVGKCAVPTMTLDVLFDQADVSMVSPITLRLDAPGSEQALLNALRDLDLLTTFHLLIRCSAAPAYSRGIGAAELLDQLSARGFCLLDCDTTDHDFHDHWLRYDAKLAHGRGADRHAHKELESLRDRLDTEERLHRMTRIDLQELRQRYRQLRSDLSSSMEDAAHPADVQPRGDP